MFKILISILLCLNILAKEKLSAPVVKELKAILASNDILHDKFFEYNSSEVEKQKNEVSQLIAKFKGNKEIVELLSKAKIPLENISQTKTELENKSQFSIYNSILIQMLNKYDIDDKYKAYYCPMVKKKWLQNVEKKADVHNPYDASMPGCGGRL